MNYEKKNGKDGDNICNQLNKLIIVSLEESSHKKDIVDVAIARKSFNHYQNK